MNATLLRTLCLALVISTALGRGLLQGNKATEMGKDEDGNALVKIRSKDAVSDWGSGAREAFITHRYVIVEEGVSPSTAASRCAVNGGELATVTSNEEFDFLAERLQPGVTYWLGAQCQNCTRVDEDKWFWPNGEPLPLKWNRWKGQVPWDTEGEEHDAFHLAMTRQRTANREQRS